MNLSKLLREKAKDITITAKELFTAKAFHAYLSKLTEGLTERWTNPPDITLADDGEDGTIAYTNGAHIHLNFNNHLVRMVSGLVRKFKVLLGILFHEIAHILYLDFAGEAAQIARLEKGELPGIGPFTSPEADELRTKLAQHQWVEFFITFYHELANFAADNHDEEAIIAANKWAASEGKQSLVEECIRAARATLKASANTVEEIMENTEGKITLSVMTSLLFQYIRHGTVIVSDMDTMEWDVVKSLDDYKADADLIATTDDTAELFDGITRIVLRLWPLIQSQAEPDQQQQSGNDGQDQGQGQGQDNDQDQSGQGQGGGDSQAQGGSSGGDSADSQQQDGGSDSQSGDSSSSNQQEGGDPRSQAQEGSSGGAQSLDQMLEDLKESVSGQGGTQAPQNRRNSKATPAGGSGQQQPAPQPDSSSGQDSGAENPENIEGQGEKGEARDGTPAPNAPECKGDAQSVQSKADGSDSDGNNSRTGEDGSKTEADAKSSDEGTSSDTSSDSVKGEERKSADSQIEDEGKDGGDDSSSMAAKRLKELLDKVRDSMARNEVQQELSGQYAQEVHAANACGPHSQVNCVVDRLGPPTLEATAMYQTIFPQVKSYSLRLQRMVRQELEDRQKGTVLRHRAFGRGIDVRDAYRPDQQFYVTKKQPDDLPEFAVTLLVDLSGSMLAEGRIEAAKTAALMLYDFCNGLNIPCMVCGHNTSGEPGVRFTIASTFESVDGQDRYRIMDMSCGAGNRDGMALEIASSLLDKRPEEYKFLFILSDGQPADLGYGGALAVKDIQSIVAKYRRRGIETIGTAIGTDRDRIKYIYGDGYLDIDDLSKLPSTITKMLKKRILRD